jgi:hypothetical protein
VKINTSVHLYGQLLSPKELQEKRLRFLHAVYELTGADRNKTIKLEAIIDKSKIGSADATSIGQYLHDEKLIGHPLFPAGKMRTVAKYTGMASASDFNSYRINWNPKWQIAITHKGIKEIEEALNRPDKPTEHFQSVTIHNYIQNSGIIHGSNLQQGTLDSGNTLIMNGLQRKELLEIINEIDDLLSKGQTTEEQTEVLKLEAKTLELHAKSSKPNLERIKQSLSSAKEVLDTIVTGAPIAAKIIGWLSGIS